jgi:N-acetylmuramoyl-L-alanine amidase
LLVPLLLSSSAPKEVQNTAPKVPIMRIVEHLDLDYQFSSATGAMRLEQDGVVVTFVLGSGEVYTEDRVFHVQGAVQSVDGIIAVTGEGVDILIRQLFDRSVRWRYEGDVFSLDEGRNGNAVRGRPGSTSPPSTAKRTYDSGGKIGDIEAIVIDAGHGGKDPGGIGYDSVREKDIVLAVARELDKELRRRFRDKEVVLTRRDDTFISLEDRGSFANRIDPGKNPIFISIHANVSFSKNVDGYETYFLSLDSFGEEARDVASRENSVLDFEIEDAGDYIEEIINRIVDIEYRRESRLLAQYIQGGIERRVNGESKNRGVKSAFFYVLKESKMPAVLVEIGFVTNGEEAQRLLQPDYQRRMARGISDGVEEFIAAFSKSEGFTVSIGN